jgi:acyl CoA:acetate/3-ketoacid CoA transferase alpha subunit
LDDVDKRLFTVCTTVDGAITTIEHFYENYREFTKANGRGRLLLRRLPTPEQLSAVSLRFPLFATGEGFRVDDEEHVSFTFDGRNYVMLRQLIDDINLWTA